MPTRCCVPQCDSRTDGHGFPQNTDLCMQWRVAIRRMDPSTKKLWKPSPYSVVCRKHFLDSDYNPSHTGQRRRLKSKAVPSVFSFSKPVNHRKPRRNHGYSYGATDDHVPDIAEEVTLGEKESVEALDIIGQCDDNDGTENDVGIQCTLLSESACRLSILCIKDNERAVSYYTGFDNYDHFMYFYHVLGPAVHHLSYQCSLLPAEDQLFLTLLKFRQARDDFDLSMQFRISETTVSKLILTWTNFLFFQLSELNVWASRETVHDTMPENFKERFPSTRVILDATETPICKPCNVDDQRASFPRYKNRNTLKTMIGCSPRGLVTYVSDSYGGSTSDRQIIERSDLCMPGVFRTGDSIMADRGIMVQDIFSSVDVKVNTPTMLKGRSQFEPEEVVHDRRVASKRIHIERVIGLGKTYKILKKDLHPSKVPLGSRIVKICYMLSNFRSSIVNRLA